MTDTPFRVLLDLTSLNIQNFKFIWMSVSPRELTTISDLKASILQKVKLLREDIKLFLREGLLLDEETIIVLRENDTIKVQYEDYFQASAVNNPDKASSSRKRNHSECNNDIILNKKRSKVINDTVNETNEISEIIKDKKEKHKKSLNSKPLDNVTDHAETLEESSCNKVKSAKKKDKKKSELLENCIESFDINQNCDSFFSFDISDDHTFQQFKNNLSSTAVKACSDNLTKDSSTATGSKNQQEKEIDISESFKVNTDVKVSEGAINNCPKKKRKRHRKRKSADSMLIDVTHCTVDNSFISFSDKIEENVEKPQKNIKSTVNDVIDNLTVVKNKFVSFSDMKRKHVIYSSVPCEIEKDSAISSVNVNAVKKCSDNTFVCSEDLSIVNTESFRDYPKVSTPAQSNGCGNPSWQVSLMQTTHNNGPPSCRKEPVANNSQEKSNVITNSKENNLTSEVHYEDLPSLNSLPEIGAHIVYKTLELDGSYSPIISNYREGIIKSINPDTEEIEIELFKEVVRPGRTGKFENLKDGEVPSPEIKTCDIVLWSSIISPKRIS